MAQHISRKELKKDEIRDTFVHGAEAALSHQKQFWTIGGVALFIALSVFGWRFYAERQTSRASAALEEAMRVYDARIRTAGEPEEPGEITYVNEKNKFDDAAKKLLDVAQRYSSTRPGLTARYFAALSQLRVGKVEEAQKNLREVERSGDDDLAALARFQLAQVLEKAGKSADAEKLYLQLIARPATMLPKQIAMLALADSYRKSKPEEAAKLYQQLKKDYPDSSVSDRAEERLASLPPKS